jgi:hypothetical protein
MDLGGRLICIRGRKLVSEKYWLRVTHADNFRVTYDAFATNPEGKIISLGRDRQSSLSEVLDAVANGHLQIE